MAIAQTLQIYKDCYELLRRMLPLITNYPQLVKRTIGTRIINTLLEMMELIMEVNETAPNERQPYFRSLRRKYYHLNMLCRVSSDEKALTMEQYTVVALSLNKIGKQINAWKNAYGSAK
ncbi:MAG: four helix bundle protein [Prevotella sp.]|nr:four helix bundle protein [Prevotella sp.]